MVRVQHGHRVKRLTSAALRRIRKVASDVGTCLAVRFGSAAQPPVVGKARFFEEPGGRRRRPRRGASRGARLCRSICRARRSCTPRRHAARPAAGACARSGKTFANGDDTPVPVLAPGAGKTKTGRLWVYVRDERPHGSKTPPAAFYRYSEDRKGEHCQAHLKSFKGVLQADGYAGFNELYEKGSILEAACWAGNPPVFSGVD